MVDDSQDGTIIQDGDRIATNAMWNTIQLDGKHFPVWAESRYNNLGLFDKKITVGDYTKDSDEYTSAWVINDLTGGGQAEIIGPSQVQRFWRGIIDGRFPNAITLPPQVDAFTNSGNFYPIGDFGGGLFGVAGTQLRLFTPTVTPGTGSYGNASVNPAKAPAAPGVPWKGKFFVPCGGSGYFALGGNIASLTVDLNASTPTFVSFCKFDTLLWGIDASGQMYTNSDGSSTWTSIGALKVDGDTPRALRIFRNAAGDPALVVVTDRCLYFVDPTTPRLFESYLNWPAHPNFAYGSGVWRTGEDLYISQGTGIIRYNGDVTIPGSGLDRDWGLPKELRGFVKSLVPEYNNLFALVQGSSGGTGTDYAYFPSEERMRTMTPTFSAQTAYSSMFAWTGAGWHQMWQSADNTSAPSWMLLSTTGGSYRLVWGYGTTAYHMDLRLEFYNPKQGWDAGLDRYQTSGFFETGRFFGQTEGLDKLLSHVIVNVINASDTETISVSIQTDRQDGWQPLGVISTPGKHSLRINVDENNFSRGVIAEWVRLRFDFARANAVSGDQWKTPVLDSVILKFIKLATPTSAYTFSVPLNPNNWMGRGGEEIRDHLDELIGAREFVPLVFGSKAIRARVSQLIGVDQSGRSAAGSRQVSVIDIPDGTTRSSS